MAEQEPIVVTDYGETELNLLAQIHSAMERMEPEQRSRAFKWLKSKYSKEWPSENY